VVVEDGGDQPVALGGGLAVAGGGSDVGLDEADVDAVGDGPVGWPFAPADAAGGVAVVSAAGGGGVGQHGARGPVG